MVPVTVVTCPRRGVIMKIANRMRYNLFMQSIVLVPVSRILMYGYFYRWYKSRCADV